MNIKKVVNPNAGYPNIELSDESLSLLSKIVGDTGENEGADDVVQRIARFYLDHKPEEYQKRVEYHVRYDSSESNR